MDYSMMLTFSLIGVATAITGASAFAFFWPMTLVHLRDRHPADHARIGAMRASSLAWLLAGRFRLANDPGLDGLGTPARIALVVLLAGLAMAAVFGALAWIVK